MGQCNASYKGLTRDLHFCARIQHNVRLVRVIKNNMLYPFSTILGITYLSEVIAWFLLNEIVAKIRYIVWCICLYLYPIKYCCMWWAYGVLRENTTNAILYFILLNKKRIAILTWWWSVISVFVALVTLTLKTCINAGKTLMIYLIETLVRGRRYSLRVDCMS